MTDRNLVIKAIVDSTQASTGIQDIIRNLKGLQSELFKLGKGQKVADLQSLAEQYRKVYGPDLARNIREATDALKQFEQIRLKTRTQATGAAAGFLKADRLGDKGFAPSATLGRAVPSQQELAAATARATSFLEQQVVEVQKLRLEFEALGQEAPLAYRALVISQIEAIDLEQQLQAILGGGTAVEATLLRRRDIINQTNQQLLEQKVALESAAQAQLAPQVQRKIEQGLQQIRQQNKLLQDAVILEQQIAQAEAEIADIRGQAAGSIFEVLPESQEALNRALQRQDRVDIGDDEQVKIEKINRLYKEQAELRSKAASLGTRGKAALNEQKVQQALAGQLPFLKEIEKRQGALLLQRELLFTPGGLGRIAPELLTQISLLHRLQLQLKQVEVGTARFNQIQRQLRATVEQVNATVASGGTGAVITALDPAQFKAGLEASMSGMQRLFQSVFSDLGRRFTATLQFAISAAILFGVQRFIREFFQTVVEVERAFADIETALSLDIDAERGTVEFRRQVEEVRQDVLLLADEFNVLPTEANEAAFKMVARFDDVGNAMVALRAQLLATKVSTIDQGEVLRALTAVAEGFASANLAINETLTIQERLLVRETEAARGYGKALDIAVHIQQQFGIEVEDTLEGTARATETFKSLGFTLIQTEALVAAVSRQLGQTGSQASEKLVRSLGQIAAPKIRNALLDLAATTESFNLQTKDFAQGADAWFKIANQIDRISKADPAAANQILQIIGQRREVEAVAAALGTADLQKAIIGGEVAAIGAAEDRFSFLEKTASETLKSIAAGFQELAQNFERLGGLASVKLFLAALDEILDFVNEALKLVIDLFDAIDNVFGFDLTGFTRSVISVAAALGLALKIAKELRVTFLALTGTQLGARVSQLLSGFFVAKGAAAAGASGLLGPSGAPIGAAAATTRFGKFSAALGAASGGIAFFVAAIAGAVISIRALDERTKRLADAFKEGREAASLASATAFGDIRRAGIDPTSPEAQQIIHNAELEAAKAWAQIAESAIPSMLERFGASLDAPFGAGLIPGGTTLGKPTRTEELKFAADFPEEIPGSREHFLETVNRLDALLLEDAVNIFREDIAEIEFTPEQIEAIQREVQFGEGPAGFDPVKGIGKFRIETTEEIVALMEKQVGAALDRLAEDAGDASANAAKNASVATDIQGVFSFWAEVMGAADLLIEEISRSIEGLQRELDQLDIDVQLGRRHPGSVPEERRRLAELIRLETDALVQIGAPQEEIDANFKKADAALIQSTDDFIAIGDQLLENGKEARSDREQRALEMLILSERIRRFTAEGLTERVLVEQNALNEVLKQDTLSMLKAAVVAAQQAKSLAFTFTERQAASRVLSAAFGELAEFWQNFGDDFGIESDAELARQVLEDKERRDELTDQLNKAAIARTRIRGPALSQATGLKADAQGALQELKKAQDEKRFGDAEAIRQTLREISAQQAQLELRTIIAAARARASARDALTQQGIALGALIAEQRLVGRIIGINSAEWHDLGFAIKSATAQLLDMVLELESLNRILGGDLTNPLTQAENAFIDASRALQLVNQSGEGELERARAELAKNQSEAGLERARFDVALFDLKFLVETDQLGTGGYISALRALLEQVDVTSHQGMSIWQEINSLIEGLTEDIGDMAFNIPGSIRLPTLFEVRRAVEADSLGVSYIDNRQIDVRVNVETIADLGELLAVLSGSLQQTIPVEGQRLATGNSGLTVGPFG